MPEPRNCAEDDQVRRLRNQVLGRLTGLRPQRRVTNWVTTAADSDGYQRMSMGYA